MVRVNGIYNVIAENPVKSSLIVPESVQARGGGGTPIETLYGDVPPKWVGF